VIDHLNEKRIADGYGVAHFYFEYQEQKQQTILEVVASIVKQLLSQIPLFRFPQEVQAIFAAKKSQCPMVDDLIQMLLSILARFSRVFIICDALDEMHRHSQRDHLLPLFHRMKDSGIALFLTTRPHPADIQDSFGSASIMELTPDKNDVRRYVEGRLFDDVSFQDVVQKGADNLHDRTVTAIVDGTAGM
jgi:hypothetical protein